MAPFRADLAAELSALAAVDRLRALPSIAGASRVAISAANQSRLSFASNDYLGLASHPALAEAAARAATRDGFGASAARLVSGDLPAHRLLEDGLATYLGRGSALLFPTGYQTNIGVLTALAGREDAIISDALNHASIIDGCRLSRARVAIYPHGDAPAAARLLADAAGARRRILVTESLFSMDGDAAPLQALAAACDAHDAVLVVDEAHALGVAGPGGRGLCAAAGVNPDVLVGTLGKAFAAAGGFAATDTLIRTYLLNRARTFIFTTALPPPVAAAATAALDIIAGPEGDRRRDVLQAHGAWLAARLGELSPGTPHPSGPIIPFILGSDARALQVSAALASRGLFVPAIRPPTVPAGSARLRITLSAAHAPSDLQQLVGALREAVRL
ncbi:MAG TPA: aminotransferase class I/II-fold pyridoxal phosphate-dependent enzyme [Polyangia bacterium]|nr:aminotransferase class I/II-fold pyridoxal phosphate-dependent enzyme [Polyangia bacterium]